MAAVELDFNRYARHGAYHWDCVSRHLTRRNAFVVARYERCLELAAESLGGLRGRRVLDLGCGDGAFAWLLWKRGAQVVAADPVAIAIDYARQEHRRRGTDVAFHLVEGYDTGLPGGSFDAVISTDVIEHVRRPDAHLREIRRLLRHGGCGVVSTPIKLTERPLDHVQHVQEWFPEEFKTVVESVFEEAVFVYSHPVMWLELTRASRMRRAAVNVLSLWRNPFASGDAVLLAQQYARVLNP
jgi:2-polyprenyl-6-hydroxyphenyl methylase/3-demethylubiquinone-9 3-methyltransferase